jgi:hypothetical protein
MGGTEIDEGIATLREVGRVRPNGHLRQKTGLHPRLDRRYIKRIPNFHWLISAVRARLSPGSPLTRRFRNSGQQFVAFV